MSNEVQGKTGCRIRRSGLKVAPNLIFSSPRLLLLHVPSLWDTQGRRMLARGGEDPGCSVPLVPAGPRGSPAGLGTGSALSTLQHLCSSCALERCYCIPVLILNQAPHSRFTHLFHLLTISFIFTYFCRSLTHFHDGGFILARSSPTSAHLPGLFIPPFCNSVEQGSSASLVLSVKPFPAGQYFVSKVRI